MGSLPAHLPLKSAPLILVTLDGKTEDRVAVPPFNSNLKFDEVGVTNPLAVSLYMFSLKLRVTYALLESISVLLIKGDVFQSFTVLLV